MLHPAALWTLAALALPLAIHLRRPPPRTVRLGSLRFLENVPRRPWRQPRWRELLLLWTRLGLLAVLALLLAEPRWAAAPTTGARHWALLDPNAMLNGEARACWQALRAEGYEPRRLAPGFPVVSGEPSTNDDAPAPDLWSLLREADAELPGGSVLAVFSSDRLAALRGVRPALANCRVEWHPATNPSGGPTHVWTVNGFPKTLEGRSDARATTFAPRPAVGPAPVRAASVLILHDAAHSADARYVEAAVRAAADSLGRPVNVQTRAITSDAENAAATDWTFWLSADPLPGGLAGRAPRVVRYASGDTVADDGSIVAPGDDAADGVRLQRRVAAAALAPAATTFWADGQGNPLLSYSRLTATSVTWELFTRFDLAWNDLPRTAALAAWVRALLFPEAGAPLLPADPVHDRRLADPSQGTPTEKSSSAVPPLASDERSTFDLHWPLWILAALLFAAERILSLRRSESSTAPVNVRPQMTAAR